MTIPTVPAVRPKPSATRAIFTAGSPGASRLTTRSEEHTSELQSRSDLVCRLLLEKKKTVPRTDECLAGLAPPLDPCSTAGDMPDGPAGCGRLRRRLFCLAIYQSDPHLLSEGFRGT